MSLYRVTKEMSGKHPIHEDYPLLPGDIISFLNEEEGWIKHAPGLGIFGFVLTEEDVLTLEKANEAKWVVG